MFETYIEKYPVGYKLICCICGKTGIYGKEDVGTSWITVNTVLTYTPEQIEKGVTKYIHYTIPQSGDYCSNKCLYEHLNYFRNANNTEVFKNNLNYFLSYDINKKEVLLGLENTTDIKFSKVDNKVSIIMNEWKSISNACQSIKDNVEFYRGITTRNNVMKIINTGLISYVEIFHEDISRFDKYDFSKEPLWDLSDNRWKINKTN